MAYALTGAAGSIVYTNTTQWSSMPGATTTVMARFDVKTVIIGSEKCLICRDLVGTGEDWWAYKLAYSNPSNLFSLFTNGDGTTSGTVIGTGLQTWAVTRTTGSGNVKAYLNGVLKESQDPVRIGDEVAFGGNPGTHDYGNIETTVYDVRIWNVVLTQAELATEYASDTPVKTTGLVAHYPLTGNGQDASGNGAPDILVSGGSWVGGTNYTVFPTAAAATAGTTAPVGSPLSQTIVSTACAASATGTTPIVSGAQVGSGDIALGAPPNNTGGLILSYASQSGVSPTACSATAGTTTVSVFRSYVVSSLVAAVAAAATTSPTVLTTTSATVVATAADASAQSTVPFASAPTASGGDITLINAGGSVGDVRLSGTAVSGNQTVIAFVGAASADMTTPTVYGATGGAGVVIATVGTATANGTSSANVNADQYVYALQLIVASADATALPFSGQAGLAVVYSGASASAALPVPTLFTQTSSLGNIAVKYSGTPGNIALTGTGSVSVTTVTQVLSASALSVTPTVSGSTTAVQSGDIVLIDAGSTGNVALAPITGAHTVYATSAVATADTTNPGTSGAPRVVVTVASSVASLNIPTVSAGGIRNASVAAQVCAATAFLNAPSVGALSDTTFPLIAPQRYARLPLYEVLVSSMDTAGDQTRELTTLDNLYEYRAGWDHLTTAQMRQFQTAIMSTWGGWKPLVFFEWDVLPVSALEFATGTGALKTFTLPARNIASASFVVGVQAVAGTVTHGTGPNGEDQVTFANAPNNGAIIKVSYTSGYRRRNVRIAGTPSWRDANPGGEGWSLDVVLVQTDLL